MAAENPLKLAWAPCQGSVGRGRGGDRIHKRACLPREYVDVQEVVAESIFGIELCGQLGEIGQFLPRR